ncbi:hypothetical protein EVAR_96347_1 [Eumeta japonica]|uniref:MADF domain-containing protein n=1 Tax=Eumeta variegata TaxID=151549 RepID=A0A4C1VZ38_EUMVA|nr:hypothetical protein EVAR_96347_1 [Eumeta japonica]
MCIELIWLSLSQLAVARDHLQHFGALSVFLHKSKAFALTRPIVSTYNTFRQHLKKKNSLPSGCGEEDVYKPIWVFYNAMASFLGDVYECSSKLNTVIQATEESSRTDGQLDSSQAVNVQEQHSSCSNVTMHEGFPPPSNRTTLKGRSSNPPELTKAYEQMQDALKTINTVFTNKTAQKENMCDIYGKLIASKLKKYFSDIEQQKVMFELDELLTKRIRNSFKQRPTSSLIAMSSTSSFDICITAATHSTSGERNSEGSGQRRSVAALLVMPLVLLLALRGDPSFVGFLARVKGAAIGTSASDRPHTRVERSSHRALVLLTPLSDLMMSQPPLFNEH